MGILNQPASDKVIELLRQRGRLGVKRSDPFLTLLLVAILKYQFRVVCVKWDK